MSRPLRWSSRWSWMRDAFPPTCVALGRSRGHGAGKRARNDSIGSFKTLSTHSGSSAEESDSGKDSLLTLTCARGVDIRCIVYGSTKGFVSYGCFSHVGFPLRTSVSPPTRYPSSLQLPLPPPPISPLSLFSLSLSPVTTFPSSSLSCCPFHTQC
jgi:hypothetical protein